MNKEIGVWFPTVKTNTGTDVFTERLVQGLNQKGIKAEITWLPLRAEYAPWTVPVPKPPAWATIAHVNTWLHSRFLPRKLPIIATLHHSIHDPALHPYKGFIRAAYHRWWIAPNERRVMRRAKKVVAVSRFAADIARQFLVDVPIDVIYNGVDTEKFRPPSGVSRPHQPFRLLYVGTWMKRKGVDLLAPIMRELGDNFELYYTGGPASDREKALMPPNMHDLGRLRGPDAVIKAMQEADAFLFPSRSEGFGLVIAEAMACGLPVIATRGSSLVEVIENGKTGILCAQDQIHHFSSGARTLMDKAATGDNLNKSARDRIKTHFSHPLTVNAYINLYLSESN